MLDQHPAIEPRTWSTANPTGQSADKSAPKEALCSTLRSTGVPQVTPRLQRSSHAIHLLRWMPLCCRWCLIGKEGAACQPPAKGDQRGAKLRVECVIKLFDLATRRQVVPLVLRDAARTTVHELPNNASALIGSGRMREFWPEIRLACATLMLGRSDDRQQGALG